MYDLTIPQQNIWNLQSFYEGTSVSNNCGAIFFEKKCDHKLLNQAINKLIELQAGMRLRFREENGHPVQYLADYQPENFLSENFENKAAFETYAQEYAKVPFNLIDSAMYRFVIFDLDHKSGILLCANHLISDAWAISIIASTVYKWYHALESGEILEEKKYDYLPFLESEKKYLHSERYEKDQAYWSEQYASRPEKCSIKPNSVAVEIPTAKRYTTAFSSEISASINQFYSEHNISQAVLFEAAVIAYLYSINPENHSISLGIPVLNRSGAAEKDAVGMCISTTSLTVPVAKDETAAELCHEITSRHFKLFRHQRFPYSHILRDLHERYDFSGNLYDVIVSFQNAKTGANATTQWFSNGYCEVGLEFHIDNRDNADCYTLNIDYQTELFHQEEEIELLVERILFIIEQIIKNPSMKLEKISILPTAEQQKVLYGFNQTEVPFTREKCVHELFAEQVQAAPDKAAVVFEGQSFTYRQLDEMSNSLAHYLRDNGVASGSIVPIISKRSWHVIVAMLGILKAGGAYMPVDPTYPKERIDYMFETAKCNLALTYGYSERLDMKVVSLENFDFAVDVSPVENKNHSEDLCYIIFTSGSTGKPKGVSLCHRNVVNYSDNNNNNVCHSIIEANNESIVSVTNIIFDIFVTESLLPLLNGICIYFANDEQVFSQKKLAELISTSEIDVMQTTPTKMRSYIMDKQNVGYLKKLKAIVLGGEALTADLYLELRSYTNAKIFNIYGPAETTVWSTNKCVEDTQITIGKPIANTQVYILDTNRKPLPIGVAGELCISGDGVGKGYLNRPELTAERFIPNPFIPGTRMYCTGDLARWRADGEIEYLGRIDTQVKIRGLRIELGEIESVMSQFEGIQLTAVTDKKDQTGRQYLVGYYTSETEIDEKKLRYHLSAKLPKYMVPNYFVHLDVMPMTASGKTDRKSLPVPEFTVTDREYIAPETFTEQKIAAMWKELLNADQISRTDDFFDLGGDSLIAIQLLTKMETAFDVVITIKDIMEHSELEQLASFIDNAEISTAKIQPTGMMQYTLLPQQMAIYTACSKEKDSVAYNMPTRIVLPKEIDREKLASCLMSLLDIHLELKSSIRNVNGIPCAVIDENAELIIEECQNEQEFVRPFDLEKAPLMRIAFTEEALLFDMHHIIADGESLNIILRDMAMLYAGKEPDASAVRYADYAAYFHTVDFSEHKSYFKEMLKCDFEPMILPEKKYKDSESGTSRFYRIDCQTFEMAKKIAYRHKLTDTMFFFGAFGILLSKYTNRTEVFSSIVMTNRSHKETVKTIGMFANTLPISLLVQGTTQNYLEKIRELFMNLFKYQELPFFSIAEEIGMYDKNVINTSFVYQAGGEKKAFFDGISLGTELIKTDTAKFDLMFELTPKEEECIVRIEFNKGKYENKLIDRLFDGYLQIIKQLEKEQLTEISVLSEEEYRKVLIDFNNTSENFISQKCIHHLFEEQVVRTPDKTAVIASDKILSYKELDTEANKIANALLEVGIGVGDIVAFALARKSYLISTILGILKAGAAYLPIDPDYPQDRIDYILADSNTKIFITEHNIAELLACDKSKNPRIKMNGNNLCYCIYTSGSTGKPKGTLLKHSGIANLVMDLSIYSDLSNCERFGFMTTITFDVATQEILTALLNGFTGVLMPERKETRSEEIIEAILVHKVDIMYATPTYFDTLTDSEEKTKQLFSAVKVVCLAGEGFYVNQNVKMQINSSNVIFENHYGPAETHVITAATIDDFNNISIGKPIANTQVYIVNSDNKPTPIGVIGELCVAGVSIGGGYLNRSDLTKEKFIDNPFGGGLLYKTGDLAYWREDGSINYVGRNDFQVKIRGQRVELGEIENAICTIDGIAQAVVIIRKNDRGRQLICAFYTGIKSDAKAIRNEIGKVLPKYMLPHVFVHLDEMPLTISGKINRKSLPDIDLNQVENSKNYMAPKNLRQKELCKLFEMVLDINRVGISDDFFDLGGDSLKAIELVSKAYNEGIYFSLQNVFDFPTVLDLDECLELNDKQTISFGDIDFNEFNKILASNNIESLSVPEKVNIGNILLTGSTGFLGIHILANYLDNCEGTAFCLVRGKDKNDSKKRLQKLLRFYFGDKYLDMNRIEVVCADLQKDKFGLTDNEYDKIIVAVNTVINAAASVKHYGSYKYFYDVNVETVNRLIDFCFVSGARLIHTSTTGISGNSFADDFGKVNKEIEVRFAENQIYVGQPLDNVYARSKFEAEVSILNAMTKGLQANIVRMGNLTNRLSDGIFQQNYESNAFLKHIKAVVELGAVPDYLLQLYAEFTPVDQAAEAVMCIACHFDKDLNVFHVNSNKEVCLEWLIEQFSLLGLKVAVLDELKFKSVLMTNETVLSYLINEIDGNGRLSYGNNIHVLNDFTTSYLRQFGFEWAEIDHDYIKNYVDYFRELGYFEV